MVPVVTMESMVPERMLRRMRPARQPAIVLEVMRARAALEQLEAHRAVPRGVEREVGPAPEELRREARALAEDLAAIARHARTGALSSLAARAAQLASMLDPEPAAPAERRTKKKRRARQ